MFRWQRISDARQQRVAWYRLVAIVLVAASLTFASDASALPASEKQHMPANSGKLSIADQKAALTAGVQAVIYGLPLVMMDITMRKATNVVQPKGFAAPVNQFAHARQFPTAAFKDVVRANVDTLYSSAFLDLSGEPIVLTVPETKGRYYLMPMMDAWTDVFASPGTRTSGSGSGDFAITGPDWRGTLPAGMQQLKSSTNTVWILGRTQTNGPQDYPAVHTVQDGYKLVPLSSFGKPYFAPEGKTDPGAAVKTSPVEQLQAMSAATYFNALARLLKSNPPPQSDAPILAKLAQIGVVPGKAFDSSTLDPEVAKGLEASVSAALRQLQESAKQSGVQFNGWRIPPKFLGNYAGNYAVRGLIALIAFGANLPADAIYPTAFVDTDGNPLNGVNRYVLHFDKGQTPPVRAFWSLTMYDEHSFFVANPIDRYAISSWMPLKANADGSLDIHVQGASPGKDKEVNWLPSAAGEFNITLRMYWPEEQEPSIFDGTWKPPGFKVERP
jgi:hypothetical protein